MRVLHAAHQALSARQVKLTFKINESPPGNQTGFMELV